MKKRNLFTLALMGAALIFTTSCSEDDSEDEPLGPSLTVTEVNSASTSGDIETTFGSTLKFAIEARKGDNDLDKFTLSQNGANVVTPVPETEDGKTFPYTFPNSDDNNYKDTIIFQVGSNPGITSYTFTVTDDLDKTSSVTFDVEANDGATALSAAAPFTWTRVGGNDGIGLDQFGLKWEQNSGAGFAVVAQDEATEMVELESSDWTDITTEEELAMAIENGTSITQYDKVSTDDGDDYDDVIAVRHNNVNYLLHIEQSTVTVSSAGTTITISGMSRN